MKKITTFALTGSVTGAFLAAAAVAQDTSSSSDPMMQGESDMTGQMMQGDASGMSGMEGMEGMEGMMPMMNMMQQMMPMMEACTKMMQSMTDQIEDGAPEARKG